MDFYAFYIFFQFHQVNKTQQQCCYKLKIKCMLSVPNPMHSFMSEVLLCCSVISTLVAHMYVNIWTIITWFVKWVIQFHDCDHLSAMLHVVKEKTRLSNPPLWRKNRALGWKHACMFHVCLRGGGSALKISALGPWYLEGTNAAVSSCHADWECFSPPPLLHLKEKAIPLPLLGPGTQWVLVLGK